MNKRISHIILFLLFSMVIAWFDYVIKPYIYAYRADSSVIDTTIIPSIGDLDLCENGKFIVSHTKDNNDKVNVKFISDNGIIQSIPLLDLTEITWPGVHVCPQVNDGIHPIAVGFFLNEENRFTVNMIYPDNSLHNSFHGTVFDNKKSTNPKKERRAFVGFSDNWVLARKFEDAGVYIDIYEKGGAKKVIKSPQLDKNKYSFKTGFISKNYLVSAYSKNKNVSWKVYNINTAKLVSSFPLTAEVISINESGDLTASVNQIEKGNKIKIELSIFTNDGKKRVENIGQFDQSNIKEYMLQSYGNYVLLEINTKEKGYIYVYKRSDPSYRMDIIRPHLIGDVLVHNQKLVWQEEIWSVFSFLFDSINYNGYKTNSINGKQGYIFKRTL